MVSPAAAAAGNNEKERLHRTELNHARNPEKRWTKKLSPAEPDTQPNIQSRVIKKPTRIIPIPENKCGKQAEKIEKPAQPSPAQPRD